MTEKITEIDFNNIFKELDRQFAVVTALHELESLKRFWLGKEGKLKVFFKELKELDQEKRTLCATQINLLKEKLERFIAEKEEEFRASKRTGALNREKFDLTLPAFFTGLGRIHPITRVERKIAAILKPFGFNNVMGPEIEKEYYCFDALNILPHHPARDMQDTFYTNNDHVLRTHTTSVQARILEAKAKEKDQGLPIKIASFGRVYRNETEDASHQAMFHQFELVWLEKGLTLSNLMALINHILKALYGKKRRVRFVPKYYPYTEPSLGAQIDCTLCKASGCPACGDSGWVTVGGSGMIHKKVLQEFGYDHQSISGFAFGLGTSRLAGQLVNIPKLKMVYENDLRILKCV